MSTTKPESKATAAAYYGSPEGMPEETLRKRLEALDKELQSLKAEAARRSRFTSAEILALHRLLHFGADCDFYYSNWPLATGCRAAFRVAAQELEQRHRKIDHTLDELITVLERIR